MGLLAVVGFVFMRLGCEAAPLILGFILGPLMEENLRRALPLSRGDITVLITEPLSLLLPMTAVGLVALMFVPAFGRKREKAFSE